MKNKIIEILNDIRPEFDFVVETNYISRGMLDSFDLISLISDLDEQFEVSIDGEDIIPENFETLEDIINVLIKNGYKE